MIRFRLHAVRKDILAIFKSFVEVQERDWLHLFLKSHRCAVFNGILIQLLKHIVYDEAFPCIFLLIRD